MVKILVVDDEPDVVFLVRRILERNGYEVLEGYSGKECLQTALNEVPDLVMLDVMMPDIDGWEISRVLKSNKVTGEIPVVMYSVRACPGSANKSLTYSGADAHIGKPASSEEILSTVAANLRPPRRLTC